MKKVKSNLLYQRLASKIPKFWKKVRTVFISIGTSLAAIWIINETMNLEIVQWMIEVCKYGLVACAAITGMTQFTTTDQKLSEI